MPSPIDSEMEPKKRYNPLSDRAPKPRITIKQPSDTVLKILHFLQGRRLPSYYIRNAGFSTPAYIDDCLNVMAQARLIKIPTGYKHRNARYRYRPWEVAPLGYKMLAAKRRLRDLEKFHSSSFDHDYLADVAFYSMRDRGPLEIPNLTVRTLDDIHAHPDCPDRTSTSKLPEYHIYPDQPIIGFQYVHPNGFSRYFYIHPFEADRGTENTFSVAERQSLENKLNHQARYLYEGGYKRRYGISNASGAWTFLNPHRAENLLDLVRRKHPKIADRVLVKVLPDFLNYDDFPPPTAHMVTEDWQTAVGTLNILGILKGERNGRRSETQAAHGAQ